MRRKRGGARQGVASRVPRAQAQHVHKTARVRRAAPQRRRPRWHSQPEVDDRAKRRDAGLARQALWHKGTRIHLGHLEGHTRQCNVCQVERAPASAYKSAPHRRLRPPRHRRCRLPAQDPHQPGKECDEEDGGGDALDVPKTQLRTCGLGGHPADAGALQGSQERCRLPHDGTRRRPDSGTCGAAVGTLHEARLRRDEQTRRTQGGQHRVDCGLGT